MLKLNLLLRTRFFNNFSRYLSITSAARKRHCCKLLVVGGGAGGIATAARFPKILHKHEVIIVEPSEIHYYQSYFTFIGGGVRNLADAAKPLLQVMPENVTWLKDLVVQFCPKTNTVILKSGDIVEYEIMIIAVGLKLDFGAVKGLKKALENDQNVSTIYSPKYVSKVFKSFKEFVSGVALFTVPNTPTKCLPASLKICLLAENYFTKHHKRTEADVIYATGLDTFMPVKVYEKVIMKLIKRKRIDAHPCTNLIEVIPEKGEAVFECLNKPGNKITLGYNMLHVTPPMSPPEELKKCEDLVNKTDFVNVDLYSLQHKKFENIFALGDCTPGEWNKTLSALGPQTNIIFQNVCNVLRGKKPEAKYNGYTACPVVTCYGKCILVEFDYTLTPVETFPFRQDYESRAAYYVKKYMMPFIYWQLFLKGAWNGTERLRKILHLEFFKIRKKRNI